MKSLREVDGDLINHWYILALSTELDRDKAIRRVVYETPYVAFRGKDGNAAAFIDKCIHRGAQLSLGTCKNGQLRCPYHGWQFASSGQLIEVPSEGPNSPIKPWSLHAAPTVEQDGVIWIWPGEVSKMTAVPPWRFPKFADKDWAQYFMITDFVNEVTHLVQNFMDVPHTVFVHDKWFRRRSLLKVPIHLLVQDGRVKVTYEQSKDRIGFIEGILNPHKKPMVHTDEYIFPNLSRVDYGFGNNAFIINSQCTPIGRYKTRVFTWITYRLGLMTHITKPFFQFYTRQVIEQDVDIMKNQGDNFVALENAGETIDFGISSGYHSTQADELHLAIDKMRLQGVQDRTLPSSLSFERHREFWI